MEKCKEVSLVLHVALAALPLGSLLPDAVDQFHNLHQYFTHFQLFRYNLLKNGSNENNKKQIFKHYT